MAQVNQDKLVKTLQVRVATKQDRIAASGNLTGLRFPPAVLSHEWRPMSPGCDELDPPTRSVIGVMPLMTAAKRAGRSAASRSGFAAVTSRAKAAPLHAPHHGVSHDYPSHDCREARRNGLTGYQPGRGSAPASSRGRG